MMKVAQGVGSLEAAMKRIVTVNLGRREYGSGCPDKRSAL
jgi:hypothetical protein